MVNLVRLLGRRTWIIAALLGGPAAVRADPGPTIEHQAVTSAPANQPLTLRAHIVSNTRFPVAGPSVYVRVGTPRFTRFSMELVPNTADLYAVTLPAGLVTDDFEYYLEAFDKDDNGPSRQGDEKRPLHVRVAQAPPVAVAEPTSPPPATPPAPEPPKVASPPPEAPPKSADLRAVESSRPTPQVIAAAAPSPALPKVMTGIGAVLLVGGAVGVGYGASIHAQVVNNQSPGHLTTVTQSQFQTAGTLYDAGWIVGGAGVVALGYGLWGLLHSSPSAPSVGVVPSPQGATLVAGGAF